MRFCTATVCLAEAAGSRYRNDVESEASMSCHDLHQNVKVAAADGETCCGLGAICHASWQRCKCQRLRWPDNLHLALLAKQLMRMRLVSSIIVAKLHT